MDLTPSLREPSQRVSPRARLMWLTTAAVQALVLLVVLLVLAGPTDVLDVPWWVVVLVALVLGTYVAVVPQWRYVVHRWEVTDTAVYTQTGWWTRERRIAPMSRIQTVDHVEGGISRLFRLATVTVTTASAGGAPAIEGLDKEGARRLGDEVTVKAGGVGGEATGQ